MIHSLVGTVAAHTTGSVLFAVHVNDAVPSGVTETSTMSHIRDDGTHGVDLTPANNSASEVTPIVAAPDYAITISDESNLVYAGQLINYTISVTNHGSQDGTGVVVTSVFPAEILDNVSASHGGSVNPAADTITWDLGDLQVGTVVKLTVSAQVSPLTSTEILGFSHQVYVTDSGSDGADPNPVDNASSDNNALRFFRFDSINNLSHETFGIVPPGVPPLTTRLMPLPVNPIFSGITEPGATLVGKIFDQHGNLIGERQVMADTSGNWMMSFPNSVVMENPHRMEIQQTAAIQSGSNETGGNFRRYFHPASHASIFFTTELTVNEVIRRSAYEMVESLHVGNQNPDGFAWSAHTCELATASTNAGQG